jgi:hypothetical protein
MPPTILPTTTTKASVREVLEKVLSMWIRSLASGDFRTFHSNLATGWKNQDDPSKLAATYRALSNYSEVLSFFPGKGKLVLLESAPYTPDSERTNSFFSDNLGPESPWLVRGEWRYGGQTTLNFSMILTLDQGDWKPLGLRAEIYDR